MARDAWPPFCSDACRRDAHAAIDQRTTVAVEGRLDHARARDRKRQIEADLREARLTGVEIARKYGVSAGRISHIRSLL